uniref:Uncharacterized protein n=1 Tax=Panagrolaimus superbus TaxID=310955 RepID=A0A914YXN4_9BILA
MLNPNQHIQFGNLSNVCETFLPVSTSSSLADNTPSTTSRATNPKDSVDTASENLNINVSEPLPSSASTTTNPLNSAPPKRGRKRKISDVDDHEQSSEPSTKQPRKLAKGTKRRNSYALWKPLLDLNHFEVKHVYENPKRKKQVRGKKRSTKA